MATIKINYDNLSDAWLDKLESSIRVSNHLLVDEKDKSKIRKKVDASEVRAADLYVSNTEKLAAISAIRERRETTSSSLAEQAKEIRKLKADLKKARTRVTKQRNELKLLKGLVKYDEQYSRKR